MLCYLQSDLLKSVTMPYLQLNMENRLWSDFDTFTSTAICIPPKTLSQNIFIVPYHKYILYYNTLYRVYTSLSYNIFVKYCKVD